MLLDKLIFSDFFYTLTTELMRQQQPKLGFSLIELSVVILVIGILVIGVTQGSRIMAESKLKSARGLTQGSPVSSTEGLTLWLETTMEKSLQNSGDAYNLGDGENVKNWNDINPTNSSPLVATESTNMPVYQKAGIGNLPTLFFDAASDSTSGDMLTVSFTPLVNSQNFTLFVVTKALEQTTSWGAVIMSRDAFVSGDRKGYNFYKDNVNADWEFWGGNLSSWHQISAALSFNQPYIFSLNRDSANYRLYQNGVLKNTTTAAYTANTSLPFRIGASNTVELTMTGKFLRSSILTEL
jgi:prepilin-type N-terminal cleavage/methylation domain-containing protein